MTAATSNRPTSPLAMWALTGRLDKDELRRQLDCFQRAGWGVVLYPRWGLELEYLGPEWFERIRFIVEQAASRAMEVWLYDEFTWPSGQAKGLVAAGGPAYLAKVLRVAADGRSEIVALPDTASLLDVAATRRFLELTHERYAKAVGEFFGNTVRAIFTDEPSLPQQHGGKLRGASHRWAVPWSDALGHALGGDFPARLAAAADPAAPALWRRYWAAFAETFEHQWVRPIADWCAAHRLAFSGHFLGEHSFGTAVAYNGSLLRQLGHQQLPGIDEIHTRATVDTCEALTLAAISRFPGRERMAEVYALGPPAMTLGTLRQMVDLLAVCGVGRFVLAICPHDFRGAVFKREYFGVWGFQQPWFREGAKVYADHVAEAAEVARRAEPLDVPWPGDEQLWEAAGPDPAQSAPLRELTQRVVTAARAALRARLSPAPAGTGRAGKTLEANWSFRLDGPNSLRVDGDELALEIVPADAELSVQRQLVGELRINGAPVDLARAPRDTRYDPSYARLPVASLLRRGLNRFEVVSTEPKPLRFLPRMVLWGAFSVNAEGRVTAPVERVTPGDWRTQGCPQLCGTGCYRTEVELTDPPRRLMLDTAGYPARVIWNGADLGLRCWPPFEFDVARAARRGRNTIEVRITSTLGHLVTPKESPPVGLFGAWLR